MNYLDKLARVFKVRWFHFEPEEVLSPDGLKLVHNKGVLPLQASALDKLQAFREYIDKPFYINQEKHRRRGWRSVKENYEINKYQFSFHVAGCAFDVTIDGLTPKEVFNEAYDFGYSGIGLYDTFTHIDTRALIEEGPVTWKNIKDLT